MRDPMTRRQERLMLAFCLVVLALASAARMWICR